MAAPTDLQKSFFASEKFAVVGASKDEEKFGTKLLKFYIAQGKDVTPVHPKESELQGITAVRSLADLPSPKTTSVSIVTPPKVTLGVLKLVKELDVPYAWVQPGAEDEAVIAYINDEGLADRVVFSGPCALALGPKILA